jgi:hypothetical protein
LKIQVKQIQLWRGEENAKALFIGRAAHEASHSVNLIKNQKTDGRFLCAIQDFTLHS